MKMLLTVIFLLSSTIALGAADCLRYMGNGYQKVWTKKCNVIVADQSKKQVEYIDSCLGKFKKKGKEFIIFNSDLLIRSGRLSKDVIITSGLIGTYAKETSQSITLDKKSASPELLKRYRHRFTFDKTKNQIHIRNEEGTFKLKKKYDLLLECQ
ncbi:MAG: hypothetical protein KC493_03955 [Bacteriovoracaceae bacterium]|nr:hypothetical protein [Bacteriovoracaceae bacterium]